MFNIQNLDVTLIGQETKERITWVTPESGNLDTIWIFSLWNLWKPRSLLHIALESSSLQGFYIFKMYERWLYSCCYSLFVAGKKRLGTVGTVCIQRRKNMCKFSTLCNRQFYFSVSCRFLVSFASYVYLKYLPFRVSKSNNIFSYPLWSLVSAFKTPYSCDLRDFRAECFASRSMHSVNISSLDTVSFGMYHAFGRNMNKIPLWVFDTICSAFWWRLIWLHRLMYCM